MSSGKSVYIFSEARCNYYFSKLDPRKPPLFDPSFFATAQALENGNETDYFSFLTNYGTHYPRFVTFGARYTRQHKMSSSSYKTASESSVNVAAQASYSGLFSIGASFSMDSSQREQAQSFQSKVETETITVGAPPPADGDAMTWASNVKDTPVPMAYKLEPIEDLFTDTYMERYKSFGTGFEINYKKIHKKLASNSFKDRYCESLRQKGDINTCKQALRYIAIKDMSVSSFYLFGLLSIESNVDRKTCQNKCLQNQKCRTVSFQKSGKICKLYQYHSYSLQSSLGSMVIVLSTKMQQDVTFKNSAVDVNIQSRKDHVSVESKSACAGHCRDDPLCAVYTTCIDDESSKERPCKDVQSQCRLYTRKDIEHPDKPIMEKEGYETVILKGR